jgi:hypothetical protein
MKLPSVGGAFSSASPPVVANSYSRFAELDGSHASKEERRSKSTWEVERFDGRQPKPEPAIAAARRTQAEYGTIPDFDRR